MLNGKDMIIHLIIGLIKKKTGCYIQMSQYFPKPYEPYGRDTNVVIYLIMHQKHQNFFKKIFKNATGIDTSKLAGKSILLKRLNIMLRSKILMINYLILLTQLLKLHLMLK